MNEAAVDLYYKFRAKNFPQTKLDNYIPVDGVEVKFLDSCNRSCIFCVNEDFAGKVKNPLDTEKFNQALFEWINDPEEYEKPLIVYGTGGEPLIDLDLVEHVFHPLGDKGITTRIVTNGTLLDQKRISRLVDMKLTGVKVTFNTLQNDRLMALMKGSRDGDAEKLLKNIHLAKKAGLWMFVRIGMGQHNYDEVVKIYRIMKDFGVDVVQIKPWIPSGLGAKNQDELSLSPRGLYDAFTEIALQLHDELQQPGSTELTVSCYPPARDLGFVVKDCANIAKLYCEPCRHTLICNFADEYMGSWYPEQGGLLACVKRRRELYTKIMDHHGVASCPARLNWSTPTKVISQTPQWKACKIPVVAQ